MQNEIKQTLFEARKAYRFLYQYQKRILDLINFIGNKYGLVYNGGYPKFSNPAPRNGSGSLDNWAWDWLNLYYYEFHFKDKHKGSDNIFFSIFLLNDTGFFQANYESKIHQTSIDKFTDVESSKSELVFVVGKNLWEGWGYWWNEPEFILNPLGEKIREDDKLMLFKHYPLEEFENEEKAMKNIRDFEQYCLEKNIDFRIIENPLK